MGSATNGEGQRPRVAEAPIDPAVPAVLLEPTGGGFSMTDGSGWELGATPCGGGWRVEGTTEISGNGLRRGSGGAGRFVLSENTDPESAERGSTSVLSANEARSQVRHLLLADGRLFRVLLRDPLDPGYDLAGWECDGAYFCARPGAEAWRIETTAAGRELTHRDTILLLFAAEILDLRLAVS